MDKVTYIKKSPLTKRTYDYFSDDICRILNFEQAFYYIEEKGIIPLDIVLSNDRQRQGKKVVLFLFSKQETQAAYSEWNERNKEGRKDENNIS